MRHLGLTLFALSVSVMLTACGDGQFAGQAGKQSSDRIGTPNAQAAKPGNGTAGTSGSAGSGTAGGAGHNPSTTDKGQAGANAAASASASASANATAANLVAASDVISGLGQNATAVGNCLANLGITQLPPDAVEDFQEIGQQEMSPFANEHVTDPDLTVKPGKVYIRLVHMQGFGPVVNFDMDLLNPAGIYCITTDSFSVFTSSKVTMCKTGKIASTAANHTNIFDNANVLKVGCD